MQCPQPFGFTQRYYLWFILCASVVRRRIILEPTARGCSRFHRTGLQVLTIPFAKTSFGILPPSFEHSLSLEASFYSTSTLQTLPITISHRRSTT